MIPSTISKSISTRIWRGIFIFQMSFFSTLLFFVSPGKIFISFSYAGILLHSPAVLCFFYSLTVQSFLLRQLFLKVPGFFSLQDLVLPETSVLDITNIRNYWDV